jgi:ribonuclease E
MHCAVSLKLRLFTMKRMLINATQDEELRVALVDGQHLFNLFIESEASQQKKANIYKGRVSRVEPSLGAAFVDYGSERHGFLPLKDIATTTKPGDGEVSIREAVKPGQEIIIQIEKEERGNKGAAITNQISLAGCYLVLMPNSPEAGGISRRVEGQDRDELREVMNQLEMPDGMGVIVRTAGVGRGVEELQWDLDVLVKQWSAINAAYADRPAPFLIYQESDIIGRVVRDYLRADIGEIVVDNAEVFEKTRSFIEKVRPDFADKVKPYNDTAPLFSRYQIQKQIESAFKREVTLPSGGSLVFDINEALVAIDINSARATKGEDIESTAVHTNLEAADEIARQLRMRDLGGLVVIDFIDMMSNSNQRDVENRLRIAVQNDRARIQLGRISRFGLLEMSRQRLRASLREANQIVCPRCTGQGTIRNVSSLSLAILRLVEEECMKERQSQIQAHVPVGVATYLLNEKRNQILELEKRYECMIIILPNAEMETPHYAINRVREANLTERQKERLSYEISYEYETEIKEEALPEDLKVEIPAVKHVVPDTKAPVPAKNNNRNNRNRKPQMGFWKRLFARLFGSEESSNQNQRGGRGQRPRGQRNPQSRTNSNNNSNRNRRPQNRRGGQNRNNNTNAPRSDAGESNPGSTERTNNNQRNAGARNNQRNADSSNTPRNADSSNTPRNADSSNTSRNADSSNTPRNADSSNSQSSVDSSTEQRSSEATSSQRNTGGNNNQRSSGANNNRRNSGGYNRRNSHSGNGAGRSSSNDSQRQQSVDGNRNESAGNSAAPAPAAPSNNTSDDQS